MTIEQPDNTVVHATLDAADLMRGMSVHHLRFTVRADEAILFDNQPGSSLRGALYEVLRDNFCTETEEIRTPDHVQHCPVCWLLANEDRTAARGQDVPRPITVEPVGLRDEDRQFHHGEHFKFGFSLIGRARDLLPYIVRAVERMGKVGIGRGRGRFTLIDIVEYSPLFDVERVLLNGRVVKQPTLGITPAQVSDALAALSHERVVVEFLTPLSLTAQGETIRTPSPSVFVGRLIERCQNLAQYYAEDATYNRDQWWSLHTQLSNAAAALQIGYDDTRWIHAMSGSRRKPTMTTISGLVGRVRWEGDLAPFLPWILWGQSFHVGKNAVKGNGWYQVVR